MRNERAENFQSNESEASVEDKLDVEEILRNADLQYLMGLSDALKYSSLPKESAKESLRDISNLAKEKIGIKDLLNFEAVYFPEQYPFKLSKEEAEKSYIATSHISMEDLDCTEFHSDWTGQAYGTIDGIINKINYSDGKIKFNPSSSQSNSFQLLPNAIVSASDFGVKYQGEDLRSKDLINTEVVCKQAIMISDDEVYFLLSYGDNRSAIKKVHFPLTEKELVYKTNNPGQLKGFWPLPDGRIITANDDTMTVLTMSDSGLGKWKADDHLGINFREAKPMKNGGVALRYSRDVSFFFEINNWTLKYMIDTYDQDLTEAIGFQIVNNDEIVYWNQQSVRYAGKDFNVSLLDDRALSSIQNSIEIISAHLLSDGKLLISGRVWASTMMIILEPRKS